jgi:hypothetical protein
MWAMLKEDNKTVIAMFPPMVSYEDLLKESNGKTLILMHLKNSPAWLMGSYIKGKFYKPGEEE